MYKLIRIALVALPLGAGAAWAQGSGTSGSAGAVGDPGTLKPPVNDDTRTPTQKKAGRIDEATPAVPGDATRPEDVPNTVPESDRSAMPERAPAPKRRTDADENRPSKDDVRDQLNSDK